MNQARKILVITHDKVGKQMAGPGMRYHQIARELARHFDVTLAAFKPGYVVAPAGAPYQTAYIKPHDFRPQLDHFDTIIALSLPEEIIKYAKATCKLLVFDLYAPVPVEDLVARLFGRGTRPEDDYNYGVMLDRYKQVLSAGDFFLCSNEAQRDFWTGFAFADGKILPSTYRDFPLYERLALCPMGINMDELKHAGQTDRLRQQFPQIKKDDFVLAWTGGVWDWFDALTPIRAIKQLKDQQVHTVRLVFFGTRHPNPDIPDMDEVGKAIALAEELGLKGDAVFFMHGWLPYDQRLDYFMAANAALYAHKPSIETRFSYRTRVLDHFLAGLPTIATNGDYFAEMIQDRQLGMTAPAGDEHAMAEAIRTLMHKKTYDRLRHNVEAIRPEFAWERTLQPLVDFLQHDHPSRPLPGSSLAAQTRSLTNKPLFRQAKKLFPRSMKEKIKRHIAK